MKRASRSISYRFMLRYVGFYVGSMLAYVVSKLAPCWLKFGQGGSCWFHVGSRCLQVGSKMAQDGSMLAQVGLKTSKMVSRGLRDASEMPREGFKMK